VTLLSLVFAGQTQADPLDDVKARKEVDAQRINQLVQDAESDALRLSKMNRLSDSVAVLRRALDEVDGTTSLTDERREKLRRELNGMIVAFDPKSAVAPPPPPIKTARPPIDTKGPTDSAKGVIDSGKQALADANDIKRKSGEGYLATNKGVMTSAIPSDPDRPLTLPPGGLKPVAKQKMTEKERTILTELNKSRTVNFDNRTLDEVIKYLSTSMGVNINVTKSDLELVGASYETPIKLDMKNVSTRSILKKMLGELNLTYIIEGETIEIMAKERAKTKLTTRTYYVGDLIAASQNPRAPAAYNQAVAAQAMQQLVVLIQKSYDPDSWEANGGPGSITADPITGNIVVRQTAEMHFLMGVGMR